MSKKMEKKCVPNKCDATRKELFTEASRSYKHRDRAVKQAIKIIEELDLQSTGWLIMATADGRYVVVMRPHGDDTKCMWSMIDRGACVIG